MSFFECGRVLDDKRLGKQRVETMQLVYALLYGSRWASHPAAKMWKGHERQLCRYGIAICDEWIARGFKDTCRDKIAKLYDLTSEDSIIHPSWIGNLRFHISHRSNLIRKLPSHYRKFWPEVPSDLPYIWPLPK